MSTGDYTWLEKHKTEMLKLGIDMMKAQTSTLTGMTDMQRGTEGHAARIARDAVQGALRRELTVLLGKLDPKETQGFIKLMGGEVLKMDNSGLARAVDLCYRTLKGRNAI